MLAVTAVTVVDTGFAFAAGDLAVTIWAGSLPGGALLAGGHRHFALLRRYGRAQVAGERFFAGTQQAECAERQEDERDSHGHDSFF
jgi:hypothetical protein